MGLDTESFHGVVADSVLDLIGRTPMVRLSRLAGPGTATLWAKLERQNPGGCVKERIGLAMIEAAEREQRLQPGALIVEPTSGNTGVGLAMVAAVKGYRVLLVMPDSLSVERRMLFEAYGADVVLTPGKEGMPGAIAKAQEIVAQNPGAFMPDQFGNAANPDAHYRTTGREILSQVSSIDAFVAGVGTGGTITGVGRFLAEASPGTRIVALEPAESPFLSQDKRGKHRIQGIGAGFKPDVLDLSIVDEIITVTSDDAIHTARRLARQEGLLVGVSSGAAAHAALTIAERLGPGKSVVTLLPDTGERYLSTGLFSG